VWPGLLYRQGPTGGIKELVTLLEGLRLVAPAVTET
jgi:hypothetical protein